MGSLTNAFVIWLFSSSTMKVTLVLVGKTEEKWVKEGLGIYINRLQHYLSFSVVEVPSSVPKGNGSPDQIKDAEGERILKAVEKADRFYLLDELGDTYSSEELAVFFQKQMNGSVRHLAFVIGGAYGFSAPVYQKAHGKLSLSKMTFTHQMVRLIFTEQIYRAMTIIKGEKYHHK
jgi:23S rRNA (pseudouridine1915-N3)-methyltransferase